MHILQLSSFVMNFTPRTFSERSNWHTLQSADGSSAGQICVRSGWKMIDFRCLRQPAVPIYLEGTEDFQACMRRSVRCALVFFHNLSYRQQSTWKNMCTSKEPNQSVILFQGLFIHSLNMVGDLQTFHACICYQARLYILPCTWF